jgi:hypothetical protein
MNLKILEQFGKYGGVPGLILLALVLIIGALSKAGILSRLSGAQTFVLLLMLPICLFFSFCYYVYYTNNKKVEAKKYNGMYKLTLSGHVEDADEHFSIGGVTISTDSQQYKTELDGNFLLTIESKDSPITARVQLVKEGYESYTKAADVPGPVLQLVLHKLTK